MRTVSAAPVSVRSLWSRFRRARLAAVIFAVVAAAAGTAAYASLSAPSTPTGPGTSEPASINFTSMQLARTGSPSPDDLITNAYSAPGFPHLSNVGLYVWSLLPATAQEQPLLNVHFEVPDDIDPSGTYAVHLALLVRQTGSVGAASFEYALDSRPSGSDIGPNFNAVSSSGEIPITESASAGGVRYLHVDFLPQGASFLQPGNVAVLGVRRRAPIFGASEYPFAVFLSSVTFKYQRTATPTAVTTPTFSARRATTGVVLRWRMSSEQGVAGYNVYRGSARVNRTLIAARGGIAGRTLSFRDQRGRLTSRYWLEILRLDGSRARMGPVRVTR